MAMATRSACLHSGFIGLELEFADATLDVHILLQFRHGTDRRQTERKCWCMRIYCTQRADKGTILPSVRRSSQDTGKQRPFTSNETDLLAKRAAQNRVISSVEGRDAHLQLTSNKCS
jgi:hypothetical protein